MLLVACSSAIAGEVIIALPSNASACIPTAVCVEIEAVAAHAAVAVSKSINRMA